MANPAGLLLVQLQRWAVGTGRIIRDDRLSTEGSDEEVLQQAQQAMVHLQNIEELLHGLSASGRNVRSYRQALPRWRAWVMAYPSTWVGLNQLQAFSSTHDLDVLENLDDILNHELPKFSDENRESLRSTFDNIRQTLIDDRSIPASLKRHIHGLLVHASTCLEEYEMTGDFELQKAVDRLLVSVNAAERISSEPSRWQAFKDKLFYPVVVGFAVESAVGMAALLPPIA